MSVRNTVRRLAPVRVGAGRVAHLGVQSVDAGPAGEPRYVAWCAAGRRFTKDGWRSPSGPAVSEVITCRNCKRDNGDRVEQVNAEVRAGVDFTDAGAGVSEAPAAPEATAAPAEPEAPAVVARVAQVLKLADGEPFVSPHDARTHRCLVCGEHYSHGHMAGCPFGDGFDGVPVDAARVMCRERAAELGRPLPAAALDGYRPMPLALDVTPHGAAGCVVMARPAEPGRWLMFSMVTGEPLTVPAEVFSAGVRFDAEALRAGLTGGADLTAADYGIEPGWGEDPDEVLSFLCEYVLTSQEEAWRLAPTVECVSVFRTADGDGVDGGALVTVDMIGEGGRDTDIRLATLWRGPEVWTSRAGTECVEAAVNAVAALAREVNELAGRFFRMAAGR